MRMKIRRVLLSGSWIRTMQEHIAVVVIQGEFPAGQRALTRGLEEGAEHPVGSRGLQDGVNDESSLYIIVQQR